MKQFVQYASALLVGLIALGCSDSHTAPRDPQSPSYSVERLNGRSGFSVNGIVENATSHEQIAINGGGSFDPSTANNDLTIETSGHGTGGFSCVTDISSGQLTGCKQGEGVRWDTVQLLQSAGFKCGGVANETKKTATTSGDVIVLQADFYRAGDGEDATFHTQMFVANYDLAPDVPGIQNVWIQGFGCGNANVNFNGNQGL